MQRSASGNEWAACPTQLPVNQNSLQVSSYSANACETIVAAVDYS